MVNEWNDVFLCEIIIKISSMGLITLSVRDTSLYKGSCYYRKKQHIKMGTLIETCGWIVSAAFIEYKSTPSNLRIEQRCGISRFTVQHLHCRYVMCVTLLTFTCISLTGNVFPLKLLLALDSLQPGLTKTHVHKCHTRTTSTKTIGDNSIWNFFFFFFGITHFWPSNAMSRGGSWEMLHSKTDSSVMLRLFLKLT